MKTTIQQHCIVHINGIAFTYMIYPILFVGVFFSDAYLRRSFS